MNEVNLDLTLEEGVQLPSVSFNFDELKNKASAISNAYKSEVITADNYKIAKANAKKIAGYINDIEKKRKAVKKALSEPIKAFEQQCKNVEAVLEEAKMTIQAQTEEYDEKTREANKDVAKAYIVKVSEEKGLQISDFTIPEVCEKLSVTKKAIRSDIDAQAERLVAKVKKWEEINVLLDRSLTGCNAVLTTPFSREMFLDEATKIFENDERFPSEITTIVEDRLQSEIEKERAVRERIAAEQKAAAEADTARLAEEKERNDACNVTDVPNGTVVEMPAQKIQPEATTSVSEKPSLHMEISIEGGWDALGDFGKMLQDECEKRGIKYQVLKNKCYTINGVA